MKYKLLLLFIAFITFGCNSEIVKNNHSESRKSDNKFYNKRIAQENFIEGSILETKGLFNEAIEQYLGALNYDPQPGIYYTLAKDYFRLNKLSSALNYIQKAVKGDNNNTEYLMLQATVYSASHLEDSSVSVYRKIIAIDSTNITALYGLGQLNEAKRPIEAISYYNKIIKYVGPEWDVLVKIAEINERMGNVNETIKTVENLIKLNPSNLQLQKLLIESYIKTKDCDKAIAMINESLVSFPDDLNLIEFKGKALVMQGKWKDASIEYMRLVKDKNISFETKLKVGTSFFLESDKDTNNLEIAKLIFLQLNHDSLDWQVNASLGEIELKKKNDSAAVEYFKKSTQIAEWNAQVWIRLGGTLFDSRRYKEAIQFMSKASEKFPNEFAINLIYGLSLSTENEHIKAKDALQRALNLNPDDLTALSAMGYTLNQLKEDDAALVSLHKALSIDPNNLQVLSIMGLIYETRKEYQISDSLYARALKVDTTNILIMNNFAYSLAERGIRLEEALSMSQKSIDKEPKNASYLDTFGWIYFKLGDYNKARINVEEAAKMEDKNATILDHLGDVYLKLGNKSKAKEYWEKAFEADSSKTEIKMKIQKGEL